MKLLMYIIAVEALTNLLTKSEFSSRIIKKRLFESKNSFFNFIHDILDCGYCTSVWSALLLSLIYFWTELNGTSMTLNPCLLDLFVLILVLHRLSNVLHFIIDWIDEKRSREIDFTEKEKEDDEDEGLR